MMMMNLKIYLLIIPLELSDEELDLLLSLNDTDGVILQGKIYDILFYFIDLLLLLDFEGSLYILNKFIFVFVK